MPSMGLIPGNSEPERAFHALDAPFQMIVNRVAIYSGHPFNADGRTAGPKAQKTKIEMIAYIVKHPEFSFYQIHNQSVRLKSPVILIVIRKFEFFL